MQYSIQHRQISVGARQVRQGTEIVALAEQLQEAEEFARELVVLHVGDQALGAARGR